MLTHQYSYLFVFVFHLGYLDNHGRYTRDDSSASDDGGDSQSTIFIIGGGEFLNQSQSVAPQCTSINAITVTSVVNTCNSTPTNCTYTTVTTPTASNNIANNNFSNMSSAHSASAIFTSQNSCERLVLFSFQLNFVGQPIRYWIGWAKYFIFVIVLSILNYHNCLFWLKFVSTIIVGKFTFIFYFRYFFRFFLWADVFVSLLSQYMCLLNYLQKQ